MGASVAVLIDGSKKGIPTVLGPLEMRDEKPSSGQGS